MRAFRVSGCFAALAILLATACSAPRVGPIKETGLVLGPAEFIADGRTSLADVLKRLGSPKSAYEDQHILIYHLSRTRNTRPWELGDLPDSNHWADLVLVFSGDGILQRHSLVSQK